MCPTAHTPTFPWSPDVSSAACWVLQAALEVLLADTAISKPPMEE